MRQKISGQRVIAMSSIWWLIVMLTFGTVPTEAGWKQPLENMFTKITCNMCKPTMYTWMKLSRWGMPLTYTTNTITKLSSLLGNISPEVVAGFIARWQEPLQYILLHTKLSAAEICSSLVADCGPAGKAFHWQVPLPPAPHHKVTHRQNTTGRLLKVLQFSDIHLEPHYMPLSNSQCANKIYCCRATDGFVPPGHRAAAGYWGSYERCDTSPALIDSMLAHISHRHGDVDYMMWTGDNAPHDVHETSRGRVLSINRDLTVSVRDLLPGVMTLPAIGNHDSHPVNSFPSDRVPPEFSNRWLLEHLHGYWESLVHRPPLDGAATTNSFFDSFRRHGYYHVEVKEWGLRYIVLNTNMCYRWNFWSLLEVADPGGQLHWLVGQLHSAELAGQRVHILGHLSPGDPDCRFDWSHQYHRIVLRFRHVISAQFFSHTHLDEFQVSLDPRGRPASITYVSPSVSPWQNVNPGYSVYYVHSGTGEVIDLERWAVDLKAINSRPDQAPRWFRLNSARASYGLHDLRPASWLKVARRMAEDLDFFSRVYRMYWGGSRRRPTCHDLQCRRHTLCNIVTSDRSSDVHCRHINRLLAHSSHRLAV